MAFAENKKDIQNKIEDTNTLEDLEKIRLYYLGKKGLVPEALKGLASLSIQDKKSKGQELNTIKKFIEESIKDQKIQIENIEISKKITQESIDVTLPPNISKQGKIHPISQTIFNIIQIFGNLNYSVETGPDIETDFNNFTALNIPEHHPAREMQDTFYIEDDKNSSVLRTHTSPVQVRTMLKEKPPIKIIVPGRTYRSDSDATHAPMFHQVEGLVVDQSSTMVDLKSTLVKFLEEFFEVKNLQYRFRPSYFPFTEPSAEMDVAYTKVNNKIKIGEGKNWLEILGCGMVNPVVLNNCKIDSKIYQGYAFGMGIERLSMLKYGITDLRSFFDPNFRWLDHYGFSILDNQTTSGL
ncbi:MAG: phenylalanine--tRNA ligase subunit alpha [Pelagibacteraceae bacterium]|nr:phenylalanine--tRNA ligase subunit alpha [Pelagibacteraceae bacterium]